MANAKELEKLADKYFAKSPFTSQAKLEEWIEEVSVKSIESDMMYQLMSDFTIHICAESHCTKKAGGVSNDYC